MEKTMSVHEDLKASVALERAKPVIEMQRQEARPQDQGFTRDKIELIKRTIAVGATDDELQLFLYTAKKTGLDPLARQIYAIKRAGKMTIQTGIDGYRLIADRTRQLAGISDYVFDSEEAKFPNKATVTVYKIIDGLVREFTASARWSEYSQGNSPMWQKMPYLMLGKCAEALALRKAFPADLSGVYTTEEMGQADLGQMQGRPMSIEDFAGHLKAIESAPDMDSLQREFTLAYVGAKGDRTSQEEIIRAKDAAKKRISEVGHEG
jgi:phage recombination protein Bet